MWLKSAFFIPISIFQDAHNFPRFDLETKKPVSHKYSFSFEKYSNKNLLTYSEKIKKTSYDSTIYYLTHRVIKSEQTEAITSQLTYQISEQFGAFFFFNSTKWILHNMSKGLKVWDGIKEWFY